MLKILHTADWHIGNFPGPAAKTGKNLRFLDICNYIEFLIAKADTLKPDIIIIAGDIFNQAKTWSDRGLAETNVITGYISRLADIAPVCILRGTSNHDGKMHFDLLSTALNQKANVYIIDEPCVRNINNLAAITFVPIFNKNLYRAEANETLDKEAENNYFCDKVRDAILDLKPQADAYNLPTVLVTHYTVLGAVMPNGQTSIFANQEVVIDPLTLIQADYWLTCLGHIHKPQQLTVCPTAFYSGSLCGLNFNDENDPHGFYMHYITDKHNITSEFIETPERAFKTLWLDDTQLNDIIKNDYNLASYVDDSFKDNIIRVIYTCTDVTNKNLNKALLENALYAYSNAFFVQEIVPAEIAITVDKTVMRNTSSVEDNLKAFLLNEQTENNTITDAQISDCLQLAQPMIDELKASLSSNQNVGVFTPIEIEVKNYRNYQNAVFNYNDVRFCVINGENGSGKSSLFMDAMLDALFEETREGEITGWINNNINIRSGSIKFTFSIGDNIYKIVRTRQKSGKATLNLSQLHIDSDNNETWIDMSKEKLRDTQDVINMLIGMDALTLKSCGLIMQDAYGLFLQADKTTRMDILGNILNLSIYNDLNDTVVDFNKICQRELDKISNEENNIVANLKNGETIQNNLNEAYSLNKEYERDLNMCSNELMIRTAERENAIKDVQTYNRLCEEIDALYVRKNTLETALTEQNNIIASANAIIATENDYITKSAMYNDLIATEKDMAVKLEKIQSLMTIRKRIEEDIAVTSNIITDADTKNTALTEKAQAIEIELANADEIAQNANLYEVTKHEIADIEAKMITIQTAEANLRDKKTALSEITYAFENKKTDYNAKFAEIDKKIALLSDSGCSMAEKSTCKFLADARQALLDKPVLTNEYNSIAIKYSEDKTALEQEISKSENEIADLKANLPDLARKKQELAVFESCAFKLSSIPESRKMLELYKTQIAEFEKIKADAVSKQQLIFAQFNDNTQQISALTLETADYDSIKARITAIGDIVKIGNDIATSKTTKITADNRVAEITKDIQALDFDMFDKIRERSLLKLDDIKISELDANILACRTKQELLNTNIVENGKTIGMLELEMKKYQDDIHRLDNLKLLKQKTSYTASNADWLKKAFQRNGIPHNIIRSVIPVLETTASNILNQMSGNTMSIELRTEKTLTNKKEIATLDVIVCDNVTGDLPYLSRSGGERVKASLSVVLALAEIKSSESGTQLGFLFIDEPPFLDSNGIDAYCDALEAIQRRYPNLKIMAITHDPEMKSRFAQSIDVVKTSNGSEIYANL